jgi:putative inorganic carbon (HCO3(-)) transporter
MNYTKWLSWGIIGGLFIALFIPFVVASGQWYPNLFNVLFPIGTFFPYITGKNFVFRILIEIIFGLYVILAIRDAKYRPRASWLMWSICAFVAWMAIATFLSVDPTKSFWGNFERMDGYINLFHLFLYFIVAGAVLSTTKLWNTFFQISVSASVLQGIYSFAQVFHWMGLTPSSQSGNRADGTFGNATYLAVYMLFNLFITLLLAAGLLKAQKGKKDMGTWILLGFYGIAALIQLFSVFFTETRGAMLGVVGGLIVAALYIAIFGRGKDMRGLRYFSWGSLALIIVLVAAFFALKDTSIIKNSSSLSRLASISLEDKTTASRFIIWNMALKGSMEKPLAGWGQENFNFVFNKYYDPAMYSQEQWFDRAHNEFLDWLIAGGVPAMLLYISLFLLAVWAIVRAEGLSVAERAALLGLLAAYAFNNLFVFDNLISLVYFYTILAFSHMFLKQKLPGWVALSKPGNDQMVAIAAPIALVAVVGCVWFFNVPGISRAQTLITALQTQDPQAALGVFKTALSQGELGRQETVEQLFQFASNSVAPSTSLSPDIKQQVYTYTEAQGKALEGQRKNDARLELFMGVFYSQFGQYDSAIAEFTKAIKDSPSKQQILFQTGVTYLAHGDTQNALALFKKAYDLDPSYSDARVLYATGLFYAGQNADADKLLTDGFGTVLQDDDRLLQTYMSLKMYDRVIAIWNARVAKNPKDTNTLLGLAGAYFQMGNTQETIATIRKVEDIDPSSKEQMESIISQIQSGTLKAQ